MTLSLCKLLKKRNITITVSLDSLTKTANIMIVASNEDIEW